MILFALIVTVEYQFLLVIKILGNCGNKHFNNFCIKFAGKNKTPCVFIKKLEQKNYTFLNFAYAM